MTPTTTTSPLTTHSAPSSLSKPVSQNLNPPGIGFFALLREDLRTHDNKIFEQGFWAVAVHRFGNWRMNIRNRWLRLPLTLVYRALFKFVECTTGISLPSITRLGRRPRIWHYGTMILHAQSIGDDVQIRQCTTFGTTFGNESPENEPVIGDRVNVGCHTCILGAVTIGNDAIVGAGSVVLNDVPPGATVAGVPARIIQIRAEDDLK